MRTSKLERKTKETEIVVTINLDGSGKYEINTPISFLNHMISELVAHSLIDLEIKAEGDLKHHIIEDVAIVLGNAIKNALGDRVGLRRFGYAIVPMDDALALASVDLVQRPYVSIKMKLEKQRVEDIACEDIIHFIETFAKNIPCTLHVEILKGGNVHHKIEAAFKAIALSLREAWSYDERRVGSPSSKGLM
ncbi:MAG: imidazoleglycerol-phosphate dehydratase HisB [Nitrososphaeria archaeon]